MSGSFNMKEFLDEEETDQTISKAEEEEDISESPELDVQKAVVESLAADKAALELKIASIGKALEEKESALAELSKTLSEKEASISALTEELATLSQRLSEPRTEDEGPAKEELQNHIKSLQAELYALIDKAANEQPRNPSAIALLDRDVELPDRFPGETRDHVLEVISKARAAAEKEGRLRRAQVLEAVLVANEPNGELAKRRTELENLIAANNNLLTGEVLEELKNRGIAHTSGEEYLMPKEILLRNY